MDVPEGFYFDFGLSQPGGTKPSSESVDSTNARAPHTQTAPSPPTTSTRVFPWVALDSATLHRWASAYCPGAAKEERNGSARAAASRCTRPLHLQLSSSSFRAATDGEANASSAAPFSFKLCFQTSPEVDALTSVVATSTHQPQQTQLGPATCREHRDVIPGRYYGGLKVWSCAVLLAQYLAERADVYGPILRGASTVAELGCGQGLPGLTALCLGARRVVFQDFNEEVLELCTRPNLAATVLANETAWEKWGPRGADAALPRLVKFVHGDWANLAWDETPADNVKPSGASAGPDSLCDVILAADVTFDKEACEKVACVLRRWLCPITGLGLVVSKDYYFGTNGGYLEFLTSAKPHGLSVELLQRVDTADKMPHVVLHVTRPA